MKLASGGKFKRGSSKEVKEVDADIEIAEKDKDIFTKAIDRKLLDKENSGVIEISVEFDIGGLLLFKLHGQENFYNTLAEDLSGKYFLQLKPYGHLFNSYYDKVIENKKNIDYDDEETILNSNKVRVKQFHELDHEDLNNFPPYHIYEKENDSKFRR